MIGRGGALLIKIVLVVVLLLAVAIIYLQFLRLPYDPELKAQSPYGFLAGAPTAVIGNEFDEIKQTGAGWARPHAGPFIWGSMQSAADAQINFSKTDKLVEQSQKYGVKVLATLWSYAEWDQRDQPQDLQDDCNVGEDHFTETFGAYRCNPYNWSSYEAWVAAVVERYDGDGVDDMPGLENPITHWEVLNEPDLQGGPPGSLRFYVGTPYEYQELLMRTSTVIKATNENAQVLIAGAAGGDSRFLNFYRPIFENPEAVASFDIANVHCITNGQIESFNVEPYAALLEEYSIDKPIWVTEAEAFITDDPLINASQVQASTAKAFSLGAQKIFFTALDFNSPPGESSMPPPLSDKLVISGSDSLIHYTEPLQLYREIFRLEKGPK